MKFLVLAACAALAAASPHAFRLIPEFRTEVVRGPLESQYQTQDVYGRYAYGYATAESTKEEKRDFDQVTRGAYSYVDTNGKLQSVQYTADAQHGFRVQGTNLPEAPVETRSAPEETPEVKKARKDFLKAYKEAQRNAGHHEETKHEGVIILPVAPEETPEVRKAREEFLRAFEEAQQRHSGHHEKSHAKAKSDHSAIPLPPVRDLANLNFRTTSYPAFDYFPYHTLGHSFYSGHYADQAIPLPPVRNLADLKGKTTTYDYVPYYSQGYISHPSTFVLPQPIAETVEVARARAEHMAAHEKARSGH